MKDNEICYSCKNPMGKGEISMGMGMGGETRYFCYVCKPIPVDNEDDQGEFGFGGDWWKSAGENKCP